MRNWNTTGLYKHAKARHEARPWRSRRAAAAGEPSPFKAAPRQKPPELQYQPKTPWQALLFNARRKCRIGIDVMGWTPAHARRRAVQLLRDEIAMERWIAESRQSRGIHAL